MTELFNATGALLNGDGTLSTQFQQLMRRFRQEGLDVRDTRFASALELGISGGGFESSSRKLAGEVGINRIEDDPIIGKAIAKASNPSKLRYFLDGSQFTFPVFHIDHIPVFRALSAAAILERDDAGYVSLLEGSLRLEHAWIIPTGCSTPKMDRICAVLHESGATVIDPLARFAAVPETYARNVADYAEIERLAFNAAGEQRATMERELLRWWSDQQIQDAWMVVDGALREPIPNAFGLVKSFTYQHLTGDESSQLFRLRAGHRTSAFTSSDKWRALDGHTFPSDATERVLWYLRFRDPAGYDPRHALVRIEAASDFRDPEAIDALSAWLLAERAPRATADARWDTLLYPIHLLERMLKRRITADTRDWPGARQRG